MDDPNIDPTISVDSDSPLFDSDLRNDIVHGIHVDSALHETDISAQLRQQRISAIIKNSGIALVGVIVIAMLIGGVSAYRAYVDANTYSIRAEDFAVHIGTRYTFDVIQDDNFLINATLIVEEKLTSNGRSLFRVEQVVPTADDTYYWSIEEDGFRQFLAPEDEYPQVYIPFPLRPGKKWTAEIYPDDRYSYNKQTVLATFKAGREVTLDLPIGPITCIKLSITEPTSDTPRELWIAKESPIARLIVEPGDSPLIAELKSID
jgi:hypothetical protein